MAIHFSFLLLLAWAANEGWQENGWLGLGWSVGATLAFFACVVLHEFGHSLTARRFGVRVQRILLMPIGGMAEFDRIPRRPREELLITAAGPAVNFAIAGLLWAAVPFPAGWQVDLAGDNALDFLRVLMIWNLWMGLFNLLPAFPMDGGRILRALLALRLPYLSATRWATNLAAAVTIPAAAWSLYQGAYIRAALFVFIFLAGRSEYRGVKQREQAEQLWRQQLIRSVTVKPGADVEPPVLGP